MHTPLFLVILATVLLTLTNSQMCDSGWWYIGFEPSACVTFQVYDQKYTNGNFAVGGSMIYGNKLNTQMTSDPGAIILVYEFEKAIDDPDVAFIV